MSRLYVIFLPFFSIFNNLFVFHAENSRKKKINANHMLFLSFYFRLKTTSCLFFVSLRIAKYSQFFSCHVISFSALCSFNIHSIFHQYHRILSWNTFLGTFSAFSVCQWIIWKQWALFLIFAKRPDERRFSQMTINWKVYWSLFQSLKRQFWFDRH